MNIISKTTAVVTTETFEIEKDGKKYIYIDYLDEKGKVIDSILRDEEGNDLSFDHADTMDEIQDFLDEQDA